MRRALIMAVALFVSCNTADSVTTTIRQAPTSTSISASTPTSASTSASTSPTTNDTGAINGRVPFAVFQNRWERDGDSNGDRDIFLVDEAQAARMIIGSDSDRLDQMCPAFSPDGARLAYGQAEGTETDGYTGGALVIADVHEMGNASAALEIDVGATSAPPCPTWSPDGQKIAFGAYESRPLPEGYAAEGDVWIVDLDSGQTTVLPDLYNFNGIAGVFYTDMEWSPDGTKLAIANGQVILYSTLTDKLETLASSTGVRFVTWSPDGTAIAYQQQDGTRINLRRASAILILQLDGSAKKVVADGFTTDWGIGPVWSPTGDQIAYQRNPNPCPVGMCNSEMSEVVLVDPQGIEVVFSIERFPFPYRVTWSPDSQQLLYFAWDCDKRFPGAAGMCLLAVPIDLDSPPVMLFTDNRISVGEQGFQLGSQSWGRQPMLP